MLRQLLVLAVVVGVVLTQNQGGRRARGRANNSPLPRRPVFQGASLSADQGLIRIARPRFPLENHRIGGRPRQQGAPPPPPRPVTPAPTTTAFPDYDYEYIDDVPQTLLPNPVAPPQPAFIPKPFPAPRPVVFTPQPSPRRPSPQPAPRRPVVTLTNLDRDFNLASEQKIRGRKEPEVKILRSWSHNNADGTFSWGYVNTDGSFKNETRGLDCVVRGIYGYVDKDTGREVSFPYESGNPCDPDAPDYYYDYDTNTMVTKDSTGQTSFARPGASRPGFQPRQG